MNRARSPRRSRPARLNRLIIKDAPRSRGYRHRIIDARGCRRVTTENHSRNGSRRCCGRFGPGRALPLPHPGTPAPEAQGGPSDPAQVRADDAQAGR